ncbi:hypothetical protein F7725_002496 [Dissostichus mawsoni]|uniref:Uncharacterized protein n=1 Tax=Dissostichus mawsoni TaxID=36200 RepID=A0A7J5Y4R1_DISMA|nr:hypothetical protein F7725_002496 [Dissostichus mawsoni]
MYEKGSGCLPVAEVEEAAVIVLMLVFKAQADVGYGQRHDLSSETLSIAGSIMPDAAVCVQAGVAQLTMAQRLAFRQPLGVRVSLVALVPRVLPG